MAFEVCAQRTYKLETKSDMKEVVEGEVLKIREIEGFMFF